jgi:hypothetical protein
VNTGNRNISDLEIRDEAERRRKVEGFSDEALQRYYASLHASKLIDDTVWVPLIEEEMARRGLHVSN